MTGYNPRLSWLNRQDKRILLALYRQAAPQSRLEASASMSTDDLKAAILAWAEGPGQVRFEAFRRAVNVAGGNGAEGEEQPCR